jgi:hypothetical protein
VPKKPQEDVNPGWNMKLPDCRDKKRNHTTKIDNFIKSGSGVNTISSVLPDEGITILIILDTRSYPF